MFEFSESKKKAWLHFFEQLGILEKYEGVFKQKLNEKSSWDLYSPDTSEKEQTEFNKKYLEKHPPFNEVIPSVNGILSENSDKIKYFNNVFIDYNTFPPYSLKKSKDIIIKSIERLSEKYSESGIPLVYTTLQLPSPVNFPSHIWRELYSNHSFDKEDCGNIEFVKALLELKREGIIAIYFFDILFFDDSKLVIKAVVHYKKPQTISATEQEDSDENEDDEEDDCFSYEDGITTPYENSDSELFILKTILLYHKQRDDAGFLAKELSYDNDSIEEICRVINRLIEDKILYLSANTHPESIEEKGIEGIEAKNGFINWQLVEKLKSNPSLMDGESNMVCFDTYMLDEIKLKGRIDIAIDEFMNDRIFTEYGLQTDKNELKIEIEKIKKSKKYNRQIYKNIIPEIITLPYVQQRKIILNELLKNQKDAFIFQIKSISNPNLEVFKTLLSLEKDGYIRIKGIGNGLSGGADNWKFLTKWDNKDYPFVKIEITKRKEIEEDISLSKKSSVNIKIENGIGYFKFHKQGENIKIGGTKTRHFRLLRFLCSPINSAKTVESVFDAIKLPKDKNDSMLNDYNPQQSFRRKLNLIQYTIKELQKNKKIQRKLKFDFNENQKTYRIEIV